MPRLRDEDRLTVDLLLDRAVTGTNREKLLRRLCRPGAGVRWVETGSDLRGYMTIRDGANAVQLGPRPTTVEPSSMIRAVRRRTFRAIPSWPVDIQVSPQQTRLRGNDTWNPKCSNTVTASMPTCGSK